MAESRRARWFLALLLFACSFTLYLVTLAPTITWRNHGADSGELVTAVHVLGIPHPPGYPLYVLLGKLFTLLPAADVAYRVNLMSAFWAGIAVVVVYFAALRLTETWNLRLGRQDNPSRSNFVVTTSVVPGQTTSQIVDLLNPGVVAAGTAGLFVAFSPTFWSQATIAEVYALNACFVALILYLALREPAPRRIYVLALIWGLSLTHHLSSLLLVPLVGLAIARGWRTASVGPKYWRNVGGGLLLGLTPYLFLPLRAAQHPPINWGDAHTWSGFWWLISGGLYRGFSFGLPWAAVPARIAAWAALLIQQFTLVGVALGLIGLWLHWHLDRAQAGALALAYAAITAYALLYNTTDSYVYLIPTHLIFALWLALGAGYLLNLLARRRRALALALSAGLLLIAGSGASRHFTSQNPSNDREAFAYASDVFGALEDDSIVLTETDPKTFALWYFAYVERPNANVAVINRTLLNYDWYRRNLSHVHPTIVVPSAPSGSPTVVHDLVDANRRRHPIFITDLDAETAAQYATAGAGPLVRVLEPAN